MRLTTYSFVGDELSDPALEENMFGRIMLFDGRNGSVLSWMPTPDRKEVYYPPQVLWGVDGDQHILFGTGGSSTPGSLWIISLMDLYRKRVDKVSRAPSPDQGGRIRRIPQSSRRASTFRPFRLKDNTY